MFEKLDAVLDRFRELDEEIAQPAIIQNCGKITWNMQASIFARKR